MASLIKDKLVFMLGDHGDEAVTRKVLTSGQIIDTSGGGQVNNVDVVKRKVLANGQIVDMSNGNLVNPQDIRLGQQLLRVTKVVKTDKSGT